MTVNDKRNTEKKNLERKFASVVSQIPWLQRLPGHEIAAIYYVYVVAAEKFPLTKEPHFIKISKRHRTVCNNGWWWAGLYTIKSLTNIIKIPRR